MSIDKLYFAIMDSINDLTYLIICSSYLFVETILNSIWFIICTNFGTSKTCML